MMKIHTIGAARAFGLLILLALAGLCAGCADIADSQSAEPTAAQEPEAPAELVKVREATLSFLRTSAYECVPAEDVVWQGQDMSLPDGYGGYRFTHGDCKISVTYAEGQSDTAPYHASLRNDEIGFCWQATVSPGGKILQTGALVEMEAGPGNFSEAYCRSQGYSYEIRVDEHGSSCGYCVFDQDRACKGWLYFYGECAP